jgi:serine/threonine-protein kinase
MGWVVVATHLHLEQRVALKFMHAANVAEHPDAVVRFLREAKAAARIQSEHVARVSDVGTLENGAPYLVMEYLEGQDLDQVLASRRSVPLAQAIDYAVQACEGLAEAHAAGIVHRDLKPANLFLARRSDGSLRVKLLDFGISKLTAVPGGLPEVGMTSTQALMGSPLYMSPEQLRSSKSVDRRTDIWSMGVILYEMFGGRSPFEGDTLPEVCARVMAEPPTPLRQVMTTVPQGLESVVMRCLEKDPLRRFPDVAALATALAPFGSAEARVGAERIARLTRASAPSLPEMRPEPGGPTQPTAISGIAQTNASFSSAGFTVPRRSPAVPLVIGGGVVVLAALVIGVVATRGKHADAPIVPTSAVAASVTPSAVASHAPPPAESTAPTDVASAPPPPTASPTGTAATTTTATAVATGFPGRPQPPRPKPTTTATTKPASTNGFGGRD